MPLDPKTGVWVPLLSPRQCDVYNCNKRIVLATGPRLCGKTRASLHRVVRHAWEVDNARVAIFTKFKKTAISGVWALLEKTIIREWLEAELSSEHGEFRYTVAPREMGSVRMNYCKIENYWGGESEIQLHSLDYDDDIEDKVLSTEYSMFYLSELQNFKSADVLNKTLPSLRQAGVAYDKMMWLADTNPPDESTEHFAYQIWFIDRLERTLENPDFQAFREQLELIEFTLEDAFGVDPKQIRDLKATWRNDPEGWARFVDGKWTKTGGHGDKHFSILFRPEIHVAGDISDRDEKNWELLNPSTKTLELITGSDLGKVNHAWVCVQKRLDDDGGSHWDVLSELVSIGERVGIDEFTEAVMEKMEKLEKMASPKVDWRHWTDTSAYNFQGGGTDEYDYLTVQRVSRGKIVFIPAYRAKAPRTVRKRVERFKALLAEGRILISADCTNVIEMFQNLRKGKKELDLYSVASLYKHIFDALSYAIYSEMFEDLEEDVSQGEVVGRRVLQIAAA